MNSTELSKEEQAWSLHELIGQEPVKKKGLAQWWFNLTAVPEAPSNASFRRRELARKSRLISSITFFLLLIFAHLCGQKLFNRQGRKEIFVSPRFFGNREGAKRASCLRGFLLI